MQYKKSPVYIEYRFYLKLSSQFYAWRADWSFPLCSTVSIHLLLSSMAMSGEHFQMIGSQYFFLLSEGSSYFSQNLTPCCLSCSLIWHSLISSSLAEFQLKQPLYHLNFHKNERIQRKGNSCRVIFRFWRSKLFCVTGTLALITPKVAFPLLFFVFQNSTFWQVTLKSNRSETGRSK